MSAVEQLARAHVVTDTAEERSAVPVALRFDPVADPSSVRMIVPVSPGSAPLDWVFARELLERGLTAPATSGDVRVWPCGRALAIVEVHSRTGVALVQFDSSALIRFLGRTY